MAAATVMAFSQIQAGRQAVKTAQYNAELYEIDAVNAENETFVVEQKKNLELSRFRQNIKSITGDTKVGYAASGVDISQGTPMDALEDIYQNAKIDEGLIQYNANIEKTNLENQAGQSRFKGAAEIQKGKFAKYGSRLKAGATLLGAASDAGMIGN